MWRWFLIGISIIGISLFGFSLIDISGGEDISANTVLNAPTTNTEGFARAVAAYDWQFPQDFGAHPDFQTEWWYYTGNVADVETGQRFGYQFTIFRRAITPEGVESASEWRTNQMYLAHFTVSDIASEAFYHTQQFSRGSAALAGATTDPRYRVWLEDWEIAAQNDDASSTRIRADAGDFALDVTLAQVKPPALQGLNASGLSPKSADAGNASYYYTLSRLLTEGTITLEGQTFAVEGTTWKDHEFSTSALGTGAQGWDWFGLIFDNDTEMMIGQIRMEDGSTEPAFGGLLIYPDGSTRYLPAETFTITATDTWTSPHTEATYPSGWTITVEADIAATGGDGTLDFSVTPLMRDQELHDDANLAYWEGAVHIEGDVAGYGYAELTGYVDTMEGRF